MLATDTEAQLRERVRQLEEENAGLRSGGRRERGESLFDQISSGLDVAVTGAGVFIQETLEGTKSIEPIRLSSLPFPCPAVAVDFKDDNNDVNRDHFWLEDATRHDEEWIADLIDLAEATLESSTRILLLNTVSNPPLRMRVKRGAWCSAMMACRCTKV
jgi:hypothetical protein